MGQWRWGPSGGGAASQGVRANSGSDSSQANNNNVALSGSATSGTAPYTYAWTVVSQPSGVSSASITSATSASATLTGIGASTNGTYVCRLTVTDAGGFLSADRVSIDVQVVAAGGWTDVANIDFTTSPTQTLVDGQENTLTGTSHVLWVDGLNAAGSMVVTNGTGLEVSFPNQGSAWANLKLKGIGIAKTSSGDWPRFRIAASISGLVFSANGDHIGCEASGWPSTGTTHKVPRILGSLKRNSSSAFVWKFYVRKGALDSSGSNVAASDVATSEPSSMVMEIRECAGGVWRFDADEATVTIPDAGDGTERSAAIQPNTAAVTSGKDYWTEGSMTGPYLGIVFKSASNGSQYCVVEKLIIQKFL